MTIHSIALKQLNRLGVHVFQRNRSPVATLNRLGAWVHIRAVLNQLVQLTHIEHRDLLRKRQIHCDLLWHTQFLDTNIGVRRNDGTGRKLYTLALKIGANAALLGSQTLLKRLEQTARSLCRRTYTRNVVIHEGGHVVLEQICPLINIPLLGILGNLLL